jgi:tetratricopeptide (TPR) repeat protein
LYLLGRYSARLDDPDAALQYAAELDTMETPGLPGTLGKDLAQSIRAHVLAYDGRIAEALQALEDAPREVPWNRKYDVFFAGHQDRYLRAELLEELGRYDEALRWYRSVSNTYPSPILSGPAHLRMAGIYERLGDVEQAVENYAIFVDLWQDSGPELRPMLEQGREALQRLTGEPTSY